MLLRAGTCWLVALGFLAVALRPVLGALAQDVPTSQETERMVAEGMVEALEAKFGATRTESELRLLALAQANRALRVEDVPTRRLEFGQFERRMKLWLEKIDRTPDGERERRALNRAAARLEAAQWIASRAVARELDEFVSSDGRWGDRDYLVSWLTEARTLLDEADSAFRPVLDALESDRRALEERLLIVGAFDPLEQLRTALPLERAWAYLRLGLALRTDASDRDAVMRGAETQFQAMRAVQLPTDAVARWGLGLALAFAAIHRPEQATPQFEFALQATGEVGLAARIRFEWLRAEALRGRYELARQLADPVRNLDPTQLTAELEPARFWISLTQLWDAIAMLREARDLLASSRGSPERSERAQRAREIGMARMTRLARRGAQWSRLVELHLNDFVDPDTPVEKQSAAELLISARRVAEQGQDDRARQFLEEAAHRNGVDPELRGEILTELALSLNRQGDARAAAVAFEQLAEQMKSAGRGREACENAVRLWLQIAQQSGAAGDASRLVLALRRLLEQQPDSELVSDARWWLPLALQASGDLAAACAAFAAVPDGSEHWEEAQYQQLVCRRALLDRGPSDSGLTERVARQAALGEEFVAYSSAARKRGESADPGSLAARRLAARALLDAAELMSAAGGEHEQAALNLLDRFEREFPEGDELARAQSLRLTLLRRQGGEEGSAGELLRLIREADAQTATTTLVNLTQSALQELDAVERGTNRTDARELATAALPLAARLAERLEADPSASTTRRDAVSAAVANIAYHAGEYSRSLALCEELLKANPRHGPLLRLVALNRSAALGAKDDPARLEAARQAWGALLRDSSLRSTRPARYWEARWHLLDLTLRAGQVDSVRKALAAERATAADFGGPPWQARFEELARRCELPTTRP